MKKKSKRKDRIKNNDWRPERGDKPLQEVCWVKTSNLTPLVGSYPTNHTKKTCHVKWFIWSIWGVAQNHQRIAGKCELWKSWRPTTLLEDKLRGEPKPSPSISEPSLVTWMETNKNKKLEWNRVHPHQSPGGCLLNSLAFKTLSDYHRSTFLCLPFKNFFSSSFFSILYLCDCDGSKRIGVPWT